MSSSFSLTPSPVQFSVVRKSCCRSPPFTCYCTLISILSSSANTFRFPTTVVRHKTFRERSPREHGSYGPPHGQRWPVLWHLTVIVIDGIARKSRTRVELCVSVCKCGRQRSRMIKANYTIPV